MMATVFPEDEDFDPICNSNIGRVPSSNPFKQIEKGLAQLRGGSAHEPIHTATGAPQFALCAAFNERLKQEHEARTAMRKQGKSPATCSTLLALGDVVHLMIDNSIPDGNVRPMNDAAREALQRLEVAVLIDATESGEPPLGEGEPNNGTA